jgi:hypothetical protein
MILFFIEDFKPEDYQRSTFGWKVLANVHLLITELYYQKV